MIRRTLRRVLKSRVNPRDYWARRFQADPDGWVAGGDRRLTDGVNQESALQLMEILTGALQRFAAPAEGKALLDAGCGMGHFTEMARKLGYCASGTDFCDLAIQRARARFPRADFRVADLTDLNLARRFDVILTVNVLVAIADEECWQSALSSLEGHLSPSGVVVILETLRQPNETAKAAEHVAFRTLDEYRSATGRLGLVVEHHECVHLSVENVIKDLIIVARGDGTLCGEAC